MDRLRLRLTTPGGAPRLSVSAAATLRADLASAAGVVTLEGEAGHFCEGLDLDVLSDDQTDYAQGMAAYRELLADIAACPWPVVALVDGVALGGGVGLLAAADMVIATPRSTFGLPETLIGLTPAVVFPYLATRLSVARTRLLALGIAPMSAETALRDGLIDEVAEDLEAAFSVHAKRFARLDARAMGHVKAMTRAFVSHGDVADAERRFHELLASGPTQARLGRMARGAPPWIEDDE